MFINYAASLLSESFNINFARATKNGKPFLMLKIVLNYSWSSPAKKWADGYYDYSAGTHFPPVWTGGSSPWVRMTYSGEDSEEVQQKAPLGGSPKFCANCGQGLKDGAKFCSGCGNALTTTARSVKVSDGQFAIEFSDLSLDVSLGKQLGRKLAESVVSLIFTENSPQERSLLLDFLSEEFASAKVNNLVNGDKTTSKCAINLAEVQKLQAAIQLGKPLTTIQAKFAELVLRSAPLSFGYWGAIKALLKFQPEKVSRSAIGEGFARIAAPGPIPKTWWQNREQIEDLRILDELVTVPLASTRYFLSRFGRRKLAELATVKPSDYLEIATGFLLATGGRGSSTIDFMFAHIVYGASNYLSSGSRSVRGDLRNHDIAPYEPKLWGNAQPELSKIWSGVSNSHEIQDFAFILAMQHKISLPPLNGFALNLALGSKIDELRTMVIAQIADDPQSWKSLSESGWKTFLSEIELNKLGKLRNSFSELETTYSLVNAIKQLFENSDNPRSERLQLLATVYFTLEPEYRAWGRNDELEGKIAAAFLLSGSSIDVENFDLLKNRLGFDALVACWSFMHEENVFDQERRSVFLDAAVGYWSKQELYQRKYTIQTLAKSAPSLYPELATALIAQTYDYELVLTYVQNLDELADTSSSITTAIVQILAILPSEDVAKTLTEIFEIEGITDSISLNDVLNSSETARLLAWAQISAEPLTPIALALESHKQLLSSTLFELNQRNISQAVGRQIEILISFFNSSKIQSEIPPALLVGATTNPAVELADLGHKILKKRGVFAEYWLEIAETQMSLAIGFGREYLRSLDKEELSNKLLLGLDSPVKAVRDMALELLDTLRDKIDIPSVYSRLAESRDPVIRGRVAEEALLAPWSDGKDLVAFDSEMLVTLRRTRNAREHVMARFEEQDAQPSDSSFVTPERLQALISLTRIGNSRDKEWALARLAQLKNAGLDIEGVSLTFVSGGQAHV